MITPEQKRSPLGEGRQDQAEQQKRAQDLERARRLILGLPAPGPIAGTDSALYPRRGPRIDLRHSAQAPGASIPSPGSFPKGGSGSKRHSGVPAPPLSVLVSFHPSKVFGR